MSHYSHVTWAILLRPPHPHVRIRRESRFISVIIAVHACVQRRCGRHKLKHLHFYQHWSETRHWSILYFFSIAEVSWFVDGCSQARAIVKGLACIPAWLHPPVPRAVIQKVLQQVLMDLNCSSVRARSLAIIMNSQAQIAAEKNLFYSVIAFVGRISFNTVSDFCSIFKGHLHSFQLFIQSYAIKNIQ